MKNDRRPPKPPARPPTIRDVAARAGVSPATVSNALSGSRGVTGDRRRAVLEAVEALGYKSNHMASSLRRGQTQHGRHRRAEPRQRVLCRPRPPMGEARGAEQLRDHGGGERRRPRHGGPADRVADRAADRRPARGRGAGRIRSRCPAFRRACRRRFWSIALSAIRTSTPSARGISTPAIAARGIYWSSATATSRC